MYKISDYIVAQPLNNSEFLLYSTLSTSILTLESDIYNGIFIEKRFGEYPEECAALEKMGFLFKGDDRLQAIELEKVRESVSNVGEGITSLTIAPTMECNARCYYCFEKGAVQGKMSMHTASAVADFIIANCCTKELTLSWFGGEPLMAVDIIDFINDKLVAAGIKIDASITTNGILINEKIVSKFSLWNISRIQITVDGVGDTYNRIKNYVIPIENPFERIVRNIKLAIGAGIKVHLRVNYKSNDNYLDVLKTLEYLHKRFGDNENIYLYGAPLDLPQIKGYYEFTDEEGETFLKILKYSLMNGYEDNELNFEELRVSDEYNRALGELMLSPFPANCYMINRHKFVIDDTGNLYKCQRHLGHHELNCGNVFTGVQENETYHYYVTSKVHDPKCEKCKMFPMCQGGCNSDRILHGDKFACPPAKTILDKLVMEYYKFLVNDCEYS